MRLRYFFSFLIVMGSASTALFAQKLGHINSAAIIEAHPKVATANAELEAYQKTLSEPFQLKAKDFQAKYNTFLEETAAGTLSQVAAEAKQTELRTTQEELGKEEEQIQFKLLQKREALLQPILTEVDGIIQALGKEGKYTMIFDISVAGALLYAQESEDLTEMVKTQCMAKP